jgi:dihydrofolate synthase/folylpolyglutamate synthase
MPKLTAPVQIENAAAAIAALRALPIDVPEAALVRGVAEAAVAGRLQVVAQSPEVVLDVAHNPQAAGQLVLWLRAHPRPTRAVFSALRDKDLESIVAQLDPFLSHWHLAGIGDAGARGMSGQALAERLAPLLAPERRLVHETVAEALAAARAASGLDERVLVFGSFHTVADALRAVGSERERV